MARRALGKTFKTYIVPLAAGLRVTSKDTKKMDKAQFKAFIKESPQDVLSAGFLFLLYG